MAGIVITEKKFKNTFSFKRSGLNKPAPKGVTERSNGIGYGTTNQRSMYEEKTRKRHGKENRNKKRFGNGIASPKNCLLYCLVIFLVEKKFKRSENQVKFCSSLLL